MTVRVDPATKWWLLLAVAGPIVVGLAIGIPTGHWVYFPLLGIMVGVLAGMFLLGRRAERAAYVNM